MATNEYVNKVVFGNDTLIDLSADTIAADKVLSGYTAHSAAGAPITGNIPTKTSSNLSFEWNNGTFQLKAPQGYYASDATTALTTITISKPSSGYNQINIAVPNGDDDYITLEFTVDSAGNSNITEDATDAYGVSY